MDSTVSTRYANKITVNFQAFQDRIPGFPEKKLTGTYVFPWLPRKWIRPSQEKIPGFPEKNLPLKKNKKRQFLLKCRSTIQMSDKLINFKKLSIKSDRLYLCTLYKRLRMMTSTFFMPWFGSSWPHSHLSSKLLTQPFLWQVKDGIDWACISRWALKVC